MAQSTDSNSPIAVLYNVFAKYPAGRVFGCDHCYTEQELAYYSATPLLDIPVEHIELMLREVHDHWGNSEAYRHFLPRMLEVFGPPHYFLDMYPRHVFNTLLGNGFKQWPQQERDAVLGYLQAIEDRLMLVYDDGERLSWQRGMCSLIDTEA